MKRHIANIITASRILGSGLLLLFPAFSPAFYGIYLLCGISDMVDGAIARITKSAGRFGSRQKYRAVPVADFIHCCGLVCLSAVHGVDNEKDIKFIDKR